MIYYVGTHTSAKTRPTAEGPSRPQVTMHDPGSDKFQEQVQWILELVINSSILQRHIHRSCERGVHVGIQQETKKSNRIKTGVASTHPLSSRKRQMTLATTSSFLSRGGCDGFGFTLVRAANLSVAVAPRQSAKSIVEDCQYIILREGG